MIIVREPWRLVPCCDDWTHCFIIRIRKWIEVEPLPGRRMRFPTFIYEVYNEPNIEALIDYAFKHVPSQWRRGPGGEILHDEHLRYAYAAWNVIKKLIDEILAAIKCIPGDKKFETCPDGTIITTHRCNSQGLWVETEETCFPEPEPEPPEPPEPIPKPICQPWEVKTKKCWDGSTIVTHKCVDGKWLSTGVKCPPEIPDCQPGETKTKSCVYGDDIVTHTCVDGKWVETDEECDDCQEGVTKDKIKHCEYGPDIVTHICIDGKWVEQDFIACPTCLEWKTKLWNDAVDANRDAWQVLLEERKRLNELIGNDPLYIAWLEEQERLIAEAQAEIDRLNGELEYPFNMLSKRQIQIIEWKIEALEWVAAITTAGIIRWWLSSRTSIV